jgi:hypothetical protein
MGYQVVLRHTELLGLEQLVQLIPLPLLPIHQHLQTFLLLRLVTHQLVLLTRQLVLATHLLRLVTLQIVYRIVQTRLVIPRPFLAILLRAQELLFIYTWVWNFHSILVNILRSFLRKRLEIEWRK